MLVNGVCLTVDRKNGNVLSFTTMAETLRKTTLGALTAGARVNLESSLRAGEEIGGHFVYGHVDAVGTAKKIERKDNSVLLTVGIPTSLQKYLAPQGSIGIDGVSLTIAKRQGSSIAVSLVDFTLKNTTLGGLKKGDMINIECDMLAKYVQRH